MGLDIFACCQCRRVPEAQLDDDGFPTDPNTVRVTLNPHFPDHGEGFTDGAIYTYTDKYNFRAGSYGGFRLWRNMLAQLADYPLGVAEMPYDVWQGLVSQKPFYELIDFSDHEGVIGTKFCAKLARDFAIHGAQAAAFGRQIGEEEFYPLYQDWKRAFDLAADHGFVQFE